MQEILERHDLRSVSCRSFYIPAGGEKGMIVLNKKDDKAEELILESLNVAGMKTAFIYAYDGAPDVNFACGASLLMRSPWFWGALTSVTALLFFVGLPGLFWLSFWGSVGWFFSRFITSRQFSSWISSWRSTVGKN
ncbi:MAG: hypothetical protein FWG09_02815 [Synergistaceae bacterium]|nr:hypothetical protein [Synergistaceae bacterium]